MTGVSYVVDETHCHNIVSRQKEQTVSGPCNSVVMYMFPGVRD